MDIDTETILPLDNIIETNVTFFTILAASNTKEIYPHIAIGIIASVPNNPLIKDAIKLMLDIGTTFKDIGASQKFSTHPTNQLFTIISEKIPKIKEGIYHGDYGTIQIGQEYCPVNDRCYISINGKKFAYTRYKNWNGSGFNKT